MRTYIFLCLFLIGCGSSESPVELSEPSDTEAPVVVTVLPEEAEDNEAFGTDSIVTYIFSETLRESTLGFRLGLVDESGDFIRNGGDRPYEISMVTQRIGDGTNLDTGIEIDRLVSAVSVSAPENRLFPLNTRLGILPSREIRDLSDVLVTDPVSGDEARGNLLEAQDGNYIFVTRRGEWKSTTQLLCPESSADSLRNIGSAVTDNVTNYVVSAGGSDEAVVSWVTSGQSNQLLVAEYNHLEGFVNQLGVAPNSVTCNASGFQQGQIESVSMADSAVGLMSDLAVTRLPNRGIFLSWQQFSSITNSDVLFYNYFDGIEWLPEAQFLEFTAAGSGISQQSLSISNVVESSMMLVWKQVSSSGLDVSYRYKSANITTSGTGNRPILQFPSSEVLASVENPDSVSSQVASLSDRYLVLVGADFGQGEEIRSYEYLYARGSWSTSLPVNGAELGVSISDISIGFDRSGDGFAIWTEVEANRRNLWFSRYLGRAWNASTDVSFPRKVENDDRGNVHSPVLSVSKSGNAAIAWVQERSLDADGDLMVRTFNAEEPFFLSEDNWTFAETIDSTAEDVAQLDAIRLSHDFEGDLAMVWKSRNNRSLFASNLLRDASSWSTSETISSNRSSKSMALAPLFNDGRMLVIYDELEEVSDTTDSSTGEILVEGIPARKLLKMTLFDEVDN